MARKRKAPAQALAAIHEEADQGLNQQDISERQDGVDIPDADAAALSHEEQILAIVEGAKEKVAEEAEELLAENRKRSAAVQNAINAVMTKISAEVRQVSAAEFFKLTPAEAASNRLGNILQRLQRLAGADELHSCAAGEVASALTVVGQPDPVREPSTQKQQQQPIERSLQAPPSSHSADIGPVGSPMKTGQPLSLMPPPPPRQALAPANTHVRLPMQNEVLYSANGSPICVPGPSAPVTSVKGAGFAVADATPAVGPSCSAVAPPTVVAFTGRTFRRETTVRGRIKQPTRSITVTTEDGKSFTVDDLIGLAGVPQKYREEVRRLIAADVKDLCELHKTVEAIEETNSVLPAANQKAAVATDPVQQPAASAVSTRATRRR